MSTKIETLKDVVDYQLCSGCGMCAADIDQVNMVDILDVGRRPSGASLKTEKIPTYCPGVSVSHLGAKHSKDIKNKMFDAWGPVIEVWEGYATNQETRFASSSGGGITALASYLLDSDLVSGVIHTGNVEETPYLTKSIYSTSSTELKSNSGSRYAVSSPCELIGTIKQQGKASVFIGKPCDSAAVSMRARDDAEISDKLFLNISFFCAGTPSTQGNINLLEREGMDHQRLTKLKYRGEGWPGMWQAKSSRGIAKELTYAESWGYLQKYRQWRCYVCADHSGEFSDISFGDPWYQEPKKGDLGKSLIVVRTDKGRRILNAAVANGYITLEKQELQLLPESQPNLLKARGALWGRLIALKLVGCPTVSYKGFNFFKFWWSELNFKDKLSSVGGTLKRIRKKKLYAPLR
jgi:coenzyme F420 hydrogenase subunit beta